jgi:hypothetical protein
MAKKQTSKFSVFHLEGGLGKHIAATAVAKCIKNNHPDRELIIVCAYPEIFLNLPFVDRVYRIGSTPYFYKDFIEGKDSLIFKHEPYFTSEHIHKELPLIENWCKLYNLEFSGESPELIFNIRQKQYGFKKWARPRPIAVIQTNGGPLTEQPYLYSWTRDMPSHISSELVQLLDQNYHVIQICRSQEQAIPGAEAIFEPMSNMELLSLLLFSEKRVLIDSSIQHAAASLNLPSTVLWVGTSPKIFGYDMHNNIVAQLPSDVKLPDSYLFDYNFHGANHECPVLDLNIFDSTEILSSI